MYRVLSASKDTYITNRLIHNMRTTDANVGLAGTLDLFKLAGESSVGSSDPGPFVSGSTTDPIELSRLLIKFDLDPLRALTGSVLDITSPSFKCVLQMFDVIGGQTLPSNYTLLLFPLSQSFDEGIGRDVNAFEDLDAANFITASSAAGVSTWFITGADAQGYVGQPNVDVITGSMSLGDLFVSQVFAEGSEDLSMDITKVISATLTHQIPDCGFRLSFSGTQETDSRTRFVKRFTSRHSSDTRLRPRVLVGFDDSIRDNHRDFFFDVSGTLFMNNFHRGQPANLVSGSALIPITGSNSLLLTLTSGTFSASFLASQATIGSNSVIGSYSASLAILSNDPLLMAEINSAASATFTEVWSSLDKTVGYLTGTLVINAVQRSAFSTVPSRLVMNITNMRGSYKPTEKPRFRVFAQDDGFHLRTKKFPIEAPGTVFDRVFYRVRDDNSNEVVIPFDTTNNATRCSTDSDGMYFDIYIGDLDVGRAYAIDILLDDSGIQQVFQSVGGRFKVELP